MLICILIYIQRKSFPSKVIRSDHSNQFTINVSVAIVCTFCHGYVKKRILIYFFDKKFKLNPASFRCLDGITWKLSFYFFPRVNKRRTLSTSLHYCLLWRNYCLSDLFHAKIEGNTVNKKGKHTTDWSPKNLLTQRLSKWFSISVCGSLCFIKAAVNVSVILFLETLPEKRTGWRIIFKQAVSRFTAELVFVMIPRDTNLVHDVHL